jgi:hypothetical protein
MDRLARARTSFRVAHRKIARMRRPILMECLDLRASFDPAYLGCALPVLGEPPASMASIEHDLDFIDARPHERRGFESMRGRVQAHLDRLGEWLEQNGYDEARIRSCQEGVSRDQDDDPIVHQMTALAIAWTIDYRGLRTCLTLGDDLEKIFRDAIRYEGSTHPDENAPHAAVLAARLPFRHRGRRRAVDQCAQELGMVLSDAERRWVGVYVKQDIRRLTARLERVCEHGSIEAAQEWAAQLLENILTHPTLWRRQLLTLRTLQSISVLDLRDDRDAVTELAMLARS